MSAVIQRLTEWGARQPLVRALLLTSSRANPHAPLDRLSDYDVILYVADPTAFVRSDSWLEAFGEPLVLFRDRRERAGLPEHTRLVLYADGYKIDFTVAPVASMRQARVAPRLPDALDVGYRVLVDKDRLTDGLPAPTYTAHIPPRPTAADFSALVEEFWWETTYVAKNLWRDELLPAKYSLDCVLRLDLLRRMVEWSIETERGWSWQPGVYGRGFKRALSPELWAALEATCAGAAREENWRALFAMTDLFRKVAGTVADSLGYAYPHDLDARVMQHLLHVRHLGQHR